MKKIVRLLFCIILLLFSARIYAGIIYVTQTGAGTKDGTSWNNALDATQLKTALDNAVQGTDFWIAAGTYYPGASGDVNASFVVKNGVSIYGGFAGTEQSLSARNIKTNATILSGDLDQSNSLSSNDAYNVITSPAVGWNSSNYTIIVIDGFTIKGANNTSNSYGGGLALNTYVILNGLGYNIRNCTITGNYTSTSGGGIYASSAYQLDNCFFSYNSANTYIGSAVYTNGNTSVTNCVFVNNPGIQFENVYYSSSLTNCSFYGSLTVNGYSSSLVYSLAALTVTNCILWSDDNTTYPVLSNFSDISVYNSDLKNGWTGTGSNNIDVNPSFADSQLELSACSQAIDAGTNTNAPSIDYLGNPRPYNGGIADIGAYEYQGDYSGITPPVISYNSLTLTCTGGSASGVTLTSSYTTGNRWYKNGIAIGGATGQTYNATDAANYTVRAVSGGCTSRMSAPATVIFGPAPGNPSVFGDNVWNVYAWDAGGASDTGQSWNTNYSGYYVDTALSFDTRNKWDASLSPSSAPGYQGCPVQVDDHSWSAKRKGFPCGHYKISIPGHDDEAQLFVNGVKVWEHDGCCDSHDSVWSGDLGPDSTVEFRGTDGSGSSYGVISVARTNPFFVTVNGISGTCTVNNSVSLTSSFSTQNQWYLNGNIIQGATDQNYIATSSGIYTVQIPYTTCTMSSPPVSFIKSDINPSVFGNNVWNVYAWNAGGGSDNGQSWDSNYAGYYIDTALSFDTRNKWSAQLSPSSAPGYQGCSVQVDNHSWSARRKGFPCGHYKISIPGHDDEGQLFVDSVKVWDAGCCSEADNVWEGNLGSNSLVEFRVTEGGGDSYGAISFNYVSANPPVPVISSPQTISCNGSSIVLTSSSSSSYQWYLNGNVINGATAQSDTANVSGNYSVQVTSAGCTATSAAKSISIGIPGDTAQFGNNVWNVYAFNAGDANGGSGAWTSNYTGYYVDTAFQFDTRNKWGVNNSPSYAPGFLGCGSVNVDNHSWSAKRRGFPCGYYSINIPGHDDAAQLFVNGVKVWEHIGCCDVHTDVWEGYLDYASTVEFRGSEGGGASYGAISFVPGTYSIAGVKFICGLNGQTTLDAGVHDSYAWSTGESTQTIAAGHAGTYSVTVSDSGCQQIASTNIQVGSPLDSLSISATSSSSCPGSTLMLNANAYANNNKITNTRIYYIDAGNLINMPGTCGSDVRWNNSYGNGWGFTWKDSGNAPVVSVRIEFAVGLEDPYGNSNNHATSLNGTTQSNITIPIWTSCNTVPNSPVLTFYPNVQAYILGGNNTFKIADTYYYGQFGLRKWPDLNNYFAKVIVTYASDISFAWSPGDLSGQEVDVNPNETTDYNLTANYQGCVSTASYHAVVNPVPTIIADGNTTICPGSSLILTASDGSNYLWSNGDTTKSTTVTTAGNYSVTVDNCSSASPLAVIYKPVPYITPSGPTTFCPGYGIDLSANDGASYAWNTGAATQSIHVTDSGSYSVQVTDTAGCTQTASQQIIVKPLDKPVLVTGTGLETCQSGYSDFSDFYVSNLDYNNTYSVNTDSAVNWGSGYFTTPYPGTYAVTAQDVLGCVSDTSVVVVTEAPGNPDDFGNNVWNVYAFDNGEGWGYNTPWTHYVHDDYGNGFGYLNAYYGYYADTALSFNTQNHWAPDGVPADAPNFQGCGMPYSYDYLFSWSAKRKGFPCGHYQINVLNHDDEAELWVDGVEVWSEGGATSNASNNVWQGVLGTNSTVVFRVNNSGGGQCFGAIDLVLTDNNVVTKPTITPNGNIDICANSSVQLTSSAPSNNLWNTGATTQSIVVNAAGNYYVSVIGSEGCTAQSDVVSVTTHPLSTFYRDADGDGYGNPNISVQGCSAPAGYVANNTDCNDHNANIHPKVFYRDADGDGYGSSTDSTMACTKPAGYVNNNRDKDDHNPTVYPGAPELCDGIDNNQNGKIDENCVFISIADTSVNELPKNNKIMKFVVMLNKNSSQTVTVNYTTQDGTATAGSDYKAQSGVVTFAPGIRRAVISITVYGDRIQEPNETFNIILSNPVNASISDSIAVGTIINYNIASFASSGEEESISAGKSFSIAPNPASSMVHISLTNYTGNVIVHLTDEQGKMLQEKKLDASMTKLNQTTVDISHYANGVYFITVFDDKGDNRTRKLVIQR